MPRPHVVAAAGDRATRAGLHGHHRDAAIEAGGTDLAGETEFLVMVARAYRDLATETPAGQPV